MYARVTLNGSFGKFPRLLSALMERIGQNFVAPEEALSLIPSRSCPLTFPGSPSLVAAELVATSVSIYVLQGSDTIDVYIFSAAVTELKEQSVRVSRQLESVVTSGCCVVKGVDIYVQESGFDEHIISGEVQSIGRRFRDAFAEKWLSRIVTPAIVFLGALMVLAGTPAVTGSLLALSAAIISFVAETLIVVFFADEWRWRSVI